MFIKHDTVLINTSKITYIRVRETLKQLVIHFDGEGETTLDFDSQQEMESFCQNLNEE